MRVIFVAFFLLFSSFVLSKDGEAVQPHSGDYYEGGVFSDDTNIDIKTKPLFLVFGQQGCAYCHILMSSILNSEVISEFLKKNFDSYYIDIESKRLYSPSYLKLEGVTPREYAIVYNLSATPLIVFVSEKGETVLRITGYPGDKRIFNIIKFVQSNQWKEKSTEKERIMMFLEQERRDG